MIRTVMLGRTGNNLFQYAAARALAEKHGTTLTMDGSWFDHRDWKSVKRIANLPIKAKLTRRLPLLSKALKRISKKHHLEYLGCHIYRENPGDTSFVPRVLDLPRDSVLLGYFQSHLYFQHIEKLIRQELSFEGRELDTESLKFADLLRLENSVAVHVRRTDYIGNPNTDICDLNYYRRAIRRMNELVPSAAFYIFSDDPAWCRKHFSDNATSIVDCKSSHLDPLNDLHLMSLANHHIIANSSYSWWAAWLGKKHAQRVLMPGEWFRGIHSPIEEKRCDGWETVYTAIDSK
ncbi:MAG: alpha-1,2-fucosyltransferase [Luteolibacter sp.]